MSDTEEVEDIGNIEEDYSDDEPIGLDEEGDDEMVSEDEEEYESEIKPDNETVELEDIDYNIENNDDPRQFDNNLNYMEIYHPEDIHVSFDEMYKLSLITRNEDGIIDDENHKTFPILSKYEKTKLIGLRVTQINKGSVTYVDPISILDPSLIAERELKEKKIPFIIKRPLPNGKYEFWNVKDLEVI